MNTSHSGYTTGITRVLALSTPLRTRLARVTGGIPYPARLETWPWPVRAHMLLALDDAEPDCVHDEVDEIPAPVVALPRRRQSLKAGQTMCWFPECRRTDDLASHPVNRTADVGLQLRLPPHYLHQDKPYRTFHNKLCPAHLPTIHPTQLLGATGLLLLMEVSSYWVRLPTSVGEA